MAREGDTLGFVQHKQKTSLKSKLPLLNTLVRGLEAGWLPGGAQTHMGRPGERRPCTRGCEEPAGLRAGLGFPGIGRKELSRLWALKEGSAAINSEPREGGS